MADNPLYNSTEWKIERQKRLQNWLGDENAVAFILLVSGYIETIDDLVDNPEQVWGDKVMDLIQIALIDLPRNPFYRAYIDAFSPLFQVCLNGWRDATTIEAEMRLEASKLKGKINNVHHANPHYNELAWSYVLRDLFIDVIIFAVGLLRGQKYVKGVSMEVRRFFGCRVESLKEYAEKLLPEEQEEPEGETV